MARRLKPGENPDSSILNPRDEGPGGKTLSALASLRVWLDQRNQMYSLTKAELRETAKTYQVEDWRKKIWEESSSDIGLDICAQVMLQEMWRPGQQRVRECLDAGEELHKQPFKFDRFDAGSFPVRLGSFLQRFFWEVAVGDSDLAKSWQDFEGWKPLARHRMPRTRRERDMDPWRVELMNLMYELNAIRWGLGERIALTNGQPDSGLNETDERAASYIRDNPGCKGDAVAHAISVTPEHFRSRVFPKLKSEGYFNRNGYRPPKKNRKSKTAQRA